ncbi:MAG: PQQ-dependent sugar dehydrogenase [Paracoccaceae bacterium]
MNSHDRASAALAALLAASIAAPAALAEDEEPSWAQGRPDTDVAMQMAPIAHPPVPLSADELPDLRVPEGFRLEVFQTDILEPRHMVEGADGTIYVSTLFNAGGKIYALTGEGADREVKVIADELQLPSGIAYKDGDLYVATPAEIMVMRGIDGRADDPPAPEVIVSDLPGEIPHGWKFIDFGPDGRLYYPVGAPCNICSASEEFDRIFSIEPDGSDRQVVVEGMRNTVGFDFHPVTGELWFTDNQRDWLSEDMPPDELNRVSRPGEQHFGYPYCHAGVMTDPEFGWGRSCAEFQGPAATFPAHSAPLGMTFYDGGAFPGYENAVFVALHGPWNRTEKFADVRVAKLDANGNVVSMQPFLTGFVENNEYRGRPASVMVMSDGSLLVSDDFAGAIYRIVHEG